MQEIARLLAAHLPFEGVPREALEETAASVTLERAAAGTCLLEQGGAPSAYLYVMAEGAVELWRTTGGRPAELVDTLAAWAARRGASRPCAPTRTTRCC